MGSQVLAENSSSSSSSPPPPSCAPPNMASGASFGAPAAAASVAPAKEARVEAGTSAWKFGPTRLHSIRTPPADRGDNSGLSPCLVTRVLSRLLPGSPSPESLPSLSPSSAPGEVMLKCRPLTEEGADDDDAKDSAFDAVDFLATEVAAADVSSAKVASADEAVEGEGERFREGPAFFCSGAEPAALANDEEADGEGDREDPPFLSLPPLPTLSASGARGSFGAGTGPKRDSLGKY
mmetsp:Transcript_23674/g.47166  ORF Transcript_23674/g.47166 Transcript_23674/m.47166 type:complete len:236 (+) Transcript_23674:1420-2127(+)